MNSFREEMRGLKPNWDGYDALPMTPKVIDNAAIAYDHFSNRFGDKFEYTPNPNGTISFECEHLGFYCYLEIGLTRFVCYGDRLNPTDGMTAQLKQFLEKTL
jgi:hypothetical protein